MRAGFLREHERELRAHLAKFDIADVFKNAMAETLSSFAMDIHTVLNPL